MAILVIVHVVNEEPFVADLEELPAADATCVIFKNPRTREQKRVQWLSGAVQSVIFSMSRITFIEVPTEGSGEEVEGFVKDRARNY
jgi:hypothetical protein